MRLQEIIQTLKLSKNVQVFNALSGNEMKSFNL